LVVATVVFDPLFFPRIAELLLGAFGMHPHNAKYYTDVLEERIIECLKDEKSVALGEIGLGT
jgi:Tat protein secretion system quality control protein TatD with DNase activity